MRITRVSSFMKSAFLLIKLCTIIFISKSENDSYCFCSALRNSFTLLFFSFLSFFSAALEVAWGRGKTGCGTFSHCRRDLRDGKWNASRLKHT